MHIGDDKDAAFFPEPVISPRGVRSTIIEAAKRAGAQAIHPGYGFLSENAAFVDACVEAGLIFVGPPADVQRGVGEKTAARNTAREAANAD